MKNIFTVTADEAQECQKVFVSHPLGTSIGHWVKTSFFQ